MAFVGFLRQSTAVDILIGPFVDDTDGVTAETGLTIDVELSKNGQALTNKNDATSPVHDGNGTIDGYYNCEFDTTDTNTVGQLVAVCFAAGALPCRHEFQVMEAAVYDALYADAATGVMPDEAGVTELLTRIPDATAGASGGLTICGSNAATTFASLTSTAAFTCGSTALGNTTIGTLGVGAISGTTLALSGAVTAASITLSGTLQAATIVSTGTTTLAALSVTGQLDAGNLLVDTTTVLTGNVTMDDVTYATFTITGAMTAGGEAVGTAADVAAAMFTAGAGTYAAAGVGSVVKEIADNAGGATLTVQDIVDGVCDEAIGAHTGFLTGITTVPKSGGTLTFNGTCSSDIKSGLATPANILGAAVPGAYGAGTLGKVVGDNLNAPVGTVDTVVDGIVTTLGVAGVGLSAIPWNAAWDTEVESECTDALNTYDPPTNAEMVARTIAAASYFDPATDAVATVTTLTNTVTLANGPHGGAAATLALKSVAVTNTDGGGTAVAFVANAAGGTGFLVSGVAKDIDADITGTLATVTTLTNMPTVAPTAVENADALLGRTIAGGGDGGRMVKDALRALRNKSTIGAGTLTVFQENDLDAAWTAVVGTAASDPINSVDPA